MTPDTDAANANAAAANIDKFVAELYARESRRVFSSLVRLLRDFDLAEEALGEAFAAAVDQWRKSGVPDNPRAWLVSTGRFKAIDALRRRVHSQDVREQVAQRIAEIEKVNAVRASREIEDDRLRLVFTCCHPALSTDAQVAMTLREVCGLTTEQIAAAFLTSPTTMAQRIVRAKTKIRDAGIPFVVPEAQQFAERLSSGLAVIYLVFNEGYSASSGDEHTRPDLSAEAIRLGRLVAELLPEPEVLGLLALMLLHESRRAARTTAEGDIVLLEDQDRGLWNREHIAEGRALIERSLESRAFGPYTVQAAISAVHADAATPHETDWSQIVALYDVLLGGGTSPVVELNRAVAVAMRDGPAAGLELIDGILHRGDLANYHLAHAARADMCRRLGRTREATVAYEQALSLAQQEPERRYLRRRLAELA
ncbi:MAG: RNA polymerase sigma factor [Planctomycetes bacterium]|nr:RNA polymerase sigma factor [Planctomycetota bacterium]